jgi:hypothetical protein
MIRSFMGSFPRKGLDARSASAVTILAVDGVTRADARRGCVEEWDMGAVPLSYMERRL